jgi:hypothetical protein
MYLHNHKVQSTSRPSILGIGDLHRIDGKRREYESQFQSIPLIRLYTITTPCIMSRRRLKPVFKHAYIVCTCFRTSMERNAYVLLYNTSRWLRSDPRFWVEVMYTYSISNHPALSDLIYMMLHKYMSRAFGDAVI